MKIILSDDGKGKYEIQYGKTVLARIEQKGDKISLVRDNGQAVFLPDPTDERIYSSARELATALAYFRKSEVDDRTLMARIIEEGKEWHAAERAAR